MTDKEARTVVHVTFRIAAGDRQRFIDLVRSHFLETNAAAKGCVFYSLAADVIDEGRFHMIEGWRDRAALDAHLASEGLKAARASLASIPMRDYHTVIYDVSSAAGYVPTDLPID